MTKAQKIKQYKDKYPSYDITGVKSISNDMLEDIKGNKWAVQDLYDLYDKPSRAKQQAWDWILDTYKPVVYSVQGNSNSFSVWLNTPDGEIMHITKDNKYIVEVK